MTLRQRHAEVTVGAVTVGSPLRVRFDLTKPADGTQNGGWVEVVNLADTSEARATTRGDPVTVVAGYQPGRTAVIFDGIVQQVDRRRDRQHPTRTLRVRVGDYVHSPPRLRGYTSRVYQGIVDARTVIRQLAADLTMQVGPLDAVPTSATVENWAYTGPTADALTQLCAAVGCCWFENDGQLRFRRRGRPRQPDVSDLVVGAGGGLIGSATVTDEGARASLWLNPLCQRGSRIRFDGVAPGGQWAVASLRHIGDTWEGPFETRTVLRAA